MADGTGTGTSGGTLVTLLVQQGPTTPTTTTPPVHHPRPTLAFTGFDLTTALMLAAMLLAVGTLLTLTPRLDLRRT